MLLLRSKMPNSFRVTRYLLIYLLMVSPLISAAEVTPPPKFEQWSSWITHGLENLKCAHRDQVHSCVWMSSVELYLGDHQALLKYRLTMDKPGLAPILDDTRTSIGQVFLSSNQLKNKQPLTVVWKNKRAWVHLDAGQHNVEVQVRWGQEIPSLKIPKSVALVKFYSADGVRDWVERDQEGAVWLKPRSIEKTQDKQSQLEISTQVFRVWRDEIPLKLDTYIQLNISGKPRELILSNLLPKGAILTQLDSPLEADWVRDGLRVYLKPGKSMIKIGSVFSQSPQAVVVPTITGGKVAAQEIWVWHRQEDLRRVRLSGLEEIDPDFTSLPSSLRGGTHTWIAQPKAILKIEELKRGVHRRPSNDLRINRKLWLDLDGEGYTAQDHISGSLRASSRLNVLTKNVLGSATLTTDSEVFPLLITQDKKANDLEGVEVRVEDLNLNADFRYPTLKNKVPALDWSEQMNQITINLNLPPGWRLFSVAGEAYSEDDWITSWSMTHIFMVALITIGMFKLFGGLWSIIALISLVLFHKEANFHVEWLSLLVVFFLLRSALNSRQFTKLATLGFSVLFLPFTVLVFSLVQNDFRIALHPQVERQHSYDDPSVPRMNYEQSYSKAKYRSKSKSLWKNNKYGELDLNQQLQQLDQSSVVQTGPGIPNWRWRTHTIYFDSPIEPGRFLLLSLVSPTWTRLICVIRSICLLAFLIVFIIRLSRLPWKQLFDRTNRNKAGLTIALLSIIPLSNVSADEGNITPEIEQVQRQNSLPNQVPLQNSFSAEPQFQTQNIVPNSFDALPRSPHLKPEANELLINPTQPSQSLINEWRQRLKDTQKCHGECIYLGDMQLLIKDYEVELTAHLHAERDSYFTLPGTWGQLRWKSVEILSQLLPLRIEPHKDGIQSSQIRVRVPQGVHKVIAKGMIQKVDSLTVPFKDIPKHLDLILNGWREDTQRNGKVSPTITISRLSESTDKDVDAKVEQTGRVSVDYSWFSVSKSLNLGPTWQVVTQIYRQRDTTTTELILPLIPGERVLSSEYETTEQGVKVTFSKGQRTVGYLSELTPIKEFKLTAPTDVRWTETWTLNCGIIWSCEATGLNPTSLGGGSQASLTWRPWPGESVKINVFRPAGTKGTEVTVNKFNYEFKPSAHLAKGTVHLDLVASKGGSKSLKLPKGSTNINLFIDQEQQFDPAKDNIVRLPIKPGKNQFKITWALPWSRHFIEQVPTLSTDLKGVNFNQSFLVGQRWLLWTQGPSWGPAILFWGKLVFALILSLCLGWRRWAPLGPVEWFFLLAGLTQHHAIVWLAVIIWFVSFSARQSWGTKLKNAFFFNLGQLALVGGTVIFLFLLFYITERNLLSTADMQVSGAKSSGNQLKWYLDQLNFEVHTPIIKVYSLPLWIWRGLMLIWALWFASKLYQWLKWAWASLNMGGGWRSIFNGSKEIHDHFQKADEDSQEG